MRLKKQSSLYKIFASFGTMFKRLFYIEQRNILDEESIQTPAKAILKNYLRNKLGLVGVAGFVAILLFSYLGSSIIPFNPAYTELTNANLRPGTNYLKYPRALAQENIKKIVSGVSFSVALTYEGDVFVWGSECNIKQQNTSDYILSIPEAVQKANIVDIATGGRHVLCITDTGKVIGWGYYGNKQTIVPPDVSIRLQATIKPVQIAAATQWSAIVGSDHNLYIWGGTQSTLSFVVPEAYQGRIEKIAPGDNNIALLLDDGTVGVIGDRATEYALSVPPQLQDGSTKITNLVSTNRNVLAIDDQGRVYTWGSRSDNLGQIPEFDGRVIDIRSGYKHFIILLDNGQIVTWGSNDLGQTDLPDSLTNVTAVFADYFQNYAIDSRGKLHTWGNRGYLFGTDQFGRDILNRIIQGGRISLTVGAIAVAISIVLAILIGLTAGYLGGWLDHALMRLADIVSSIPFLPLAITLSYALSSRISQMNRMYLIMFILGILSWPGLARLLRAQLLLEREKDFVLAARALGIKQSKIMTRHILPNVFNLVIVNITLGYASSLLAEAGLSFLGFGVVEPTPSWGNMLTSAQQSTVIQHYWWRWLLPGLFVVLAALFANLIGDALREAMDPKANEKPGGQK